LILSTSFLADRSSSYQQSGGVGY